VKLLAETLEAVVCERPKPRRGKPQHLCADAGYKGKAAVQRQLLFPFDDSYFSLRTTSTAINC
jgi:hypothetical protein